MIRRLAALLVISLISSSCAVLGFKSDCKGTEVIANFEQVGDLVENANVQSSDVVIGTISDIELDGWNARATMCLEDDQDIPKNSEAVVRSTSLLGEKFIDLRPTAEEPPYLEDGDVIDVDRTSKATELEDVFARLATILGTGNLEKLNQFTSAQAKILRNHAGDLRTVLSDLKSFTDVLASSKEDLGMAVDSLDSVSRTVLDDSGVLKDFIRSFADSSGVLANQKTALQDLLFSLERFSDISAQLLRETEAGLNSQFDDLRPVLRVAVRNSQNLSKGLRTLARFTQWFPESMPGDYLQLDVCQASPDEYGEGVDCPQSDDNNPGAKSGSGTTSTPPSSSIESILERPLEEVTR